MKLQSRGTRTKVGGNTEAPRTFSINATDVAFSVLSSGLYNDKIRAIIRELSCNAWDAHVMAGKKDVPFDIHLPTDFEPLFRITDYGTGLSHEDVMNLYCTYFATNKNQSNDVVGAMGLGSKSPFCYTQAQDEPQGFTVVSRFDGMKRIYSAYVESGAPTIVCLKEDPTDEPNGLEVQFAVNSDDIWEFENKAKKALEFFVPMPNINIEDFEPETQDYAIRTPLWGLRKEGHGLRAIQGMVQYNVGSIDSSRMNQDQARVAEMPLDLFFPIGELSVAASRETLSNDQRTIGNILAMLSKVYEGLVEETRKSLDECKYAWEARLRLMSVLDSAIGPMVKKAYEDGKFFGKYKNFVLTSQTPNLNELNYKAMQVTKYGRTGKKRATKTPLFLKRDKLERQIALDSVKADIKVEKNFLREVEVGENVIFILNDLGIKGTEKYIQAYVQGRDEEGKTFCDTAYAFSAATGKFQMKSMMKEFKKAMDIIGNPPYITTSYLKENFQHLVDAMKPTPRPKVTGILEVTGNGCPRYRSSSRSGWSTRTWSKVPEAQIPSGMKFYVPVVKRAVVDSTFNFYNAEEFVDLLRNAKTSKLFPLLTLSSRIFGLTERAIERKADKDWVNVLDYIANNAQTAISDEKVLELSIYLEPFECQHSEVLEEVLKREKEFKDSPLVDFARAYLAVKGKRKEAEAGAISELISKLTKIGKYKRGEVTNFKSLWRKLVVERYPLLGLSIAKYSPYDGGIPVSYVKSVVEYIKLMDAK
jgi:hypothetical protein